MKKVFSLAFAALAVVFMSSFIIHEEMYKFDTNASSVSWKGYKVTGSHEGKIGVKAGELRFGHGGILAGATVEIDMNNMTCTDLDAKTGGSLVGHLKADDFFGTTKYATAKLVTTKVAAQDTKGNYKVTANLTIKDVTKEVKFFVSVSDKDGGKAATGKLTIDRSDFNIKYGSGSFFDGLGDKTIYDEFDMTFNIVAKK
jgi:polyisoprenoid-binding protein YceI